MMKDYKAMSSSIGVKLLKICSTCKKEKDIALFSKQSSNPDGLKYKCKSCQSIRSKELREANPDKYNLYSAKYRKANKEKYAEWRFKKRHGISKENAALELNFDDGCKICGTKDFGTEGWVIDHDHSCCGKLNTCNKCRRGILCEPCNKMLGFAKDNKEVLAKAVEYLEEYERSK